MSSGAPTLPLFVANPAHEEACIQELREHLRQAGQQSVEQNVADLTTPDAGRFAYLVPHLTPAGFDRLLVSGCAIGSEMILARNSFGFKEITGSEIKESLLNLARRRLDGQVGFSTILYDGSRLPCEDATFSAAVSAHIIEHTPSPREYLREQMRVLRPGGVLFLEFPHRYYPVELHTGLPSVEWLPLALRNLVLRFRASRYSGASPLQRLHYSEIRRELRPVSLWQIRLWLLVSGAGRVLHHYEPAPGFTRVLVQKAQRNR